MRVEPCVMSRGLCVLALLLCLACGNLFAQGVSSAELTHKAQEYDGKLVVYSGEIVGDLMKRGEFAWANISDGENAIGVWLNSQQALQIRRTGSYKSVGDEIEVSGIFHHACVEHGGDLDIHALSLRRTADGRLITERMNPAKANQALILLGVLFSVWILAVLKRK